MTLYQKIYDDLYMKIQSGRYKAGDVLPTEEQICTLYGVSRITATRALNDLKAKGFIERKKKKGSVVLPVPGAVPERNNSRKIAVVFSYFDNFDSKIVNALAPFAQKKNCAVMTFDSCHSQEKEGEILKSLLSQKILGLILWPVSRSSNLDVLNQFVLDNVPICFLDYASYGIEAPCVSTDNAEGMYNLTKLLLSLGHKRIAYFPFKKNFLPTEEERFDAYCRAIVRNGSALDPRLFIPLPGDVRETTIENYDKLAICAEGAMNYLSTLTLRPSAIVCVNDAMAMHVINAAQKRGLSVPGDLSVTGFDNLAISVRFDITTSSQDFGEMAKQALNLIFYQLSDASLINRFPETRRIRSTLWERGSTGKHEK
ncbi:MAG: GntR family transcriptional regulator [Candidatus Borkfalkiaceae bacterium]|nr:GntR family transcriptional regulator [Christensenellaceae bacterium]